MAQNWVQPKFPEDDESLPKEIRGTPIGYVVDPNFRPNPLDVGTVRTDGVSAAHTGYNVSDYSGTFKRRLVPTNPAARPGWEQIHPKPALQVDLIEAHNEELAESANVDTDSVAEHLTNFSAKVTESVPKSDIAENLTSFSDNLRSITSGDDGSSK